MTDQGLPAILLLGAGRMGAAMFASWAGLGLPSSVLVDPALPPNVARPQDRLVASIADLPAGFAPKAAILAIKPQIAESLLPVLCSLLPADTIVLSILAGLPIARLADLLGGGRAVVRAMPNTPAAIGQGMTVAVAGPGVSSAQHDLCARLLTACGELAWLGDETLIDAVTAVSGCGPAYVFLLAELLEKEGIALGLPHALARQLARKTVSGAGALLAASADESGQLRRDVTSPNGVTERALAVLMEAAAWPASIARALAAAVARSRELAR